MVHALHINDNNLVLQSLSGSTDPVLQRSQGYALFEGDSVLFDIDGDTPPVSQCRKTPLQINSRYWQQCAQSAISENAAGMRHAADLIWKHLGAFKEKYSLSELALIVPANYRDSHLQLLLGVAKANDLAITSLISKPAWSARQSRINAPTMTHIDVQMHQTVVSTITVSDSQVALDNVKVVADMSLVNVQEALLQSLQSCFIREDRFDPLHDAGTEQQLFDQLPVLVERAINNQKNNVGVEHNGKLYHAVIEPKQLQSALAPLLDLVEQYRSQPVLVDVNTEFDVSGLELENVTWVADIDPLEPSFAQSADQDGNVVYRTSLPALQLVTSESSKSTEAELSEPQNQTEAVAGVAAGLASHVMLKGVAIAIAQADIGLIGTELVLSKNQRGGNFAKKLNEGELQIINEVGRTSIKPNDRLISPLGDGVITALQLL